MPVVIYKRKPRSEEVRKKISEGCKKSGVGKWSKGDMPSGENHYAWNEEVGYHGVHSWIRRTKGKAKLCEVCGDKEAKKYEWSNVDHKYRRAEEDYTSMCIKCHRKYDNNLKLTI